MEVVQPKNATLFAVVNDFRCPECGSKTITFRRGQFAGIWECLNDQCGTSDSCEHAEFHIEEHEDWPTGPLDNPQAYEIYVCDLCDQTLEDRSPVLDRLEAAYDD